MICHDKALEIDLVSQLCLTVGRSAEVLKCATQIF